MQTNRSYRYHQETTWELEIILEENVSANSHIAGIVIESEAFTPSIWLDSQALAFVFSEHLFTQFKYFGTKSVLNPTVGIRDNRA